jgi:hypothetical protein
MAVDQKLRGGGMHRGRNDYAWLIGDVLDFGWNTYIRESIEVAEIDLYRGFMREEHVKGSWQPFNVAH